MLDDRSARVGDAPRPAEPPVTAALACPVRGVVSPEVALLVEAAQRVARVVPSERDGAVTLADTAALLGVVDLLRSAVLGRLADVETRQLHQLTDARSTSAWVARQDSGTDKGQVALARRLSRTPFLAAQVHAGALLVADAERVGRALDALRPHLDRPDGRIDGQDGEQVVTALVVDGVAALVCEARGGLDDDDPRLAALLDQLRALAADTALGQLGRLERAFVLVARELAGCGSRDQLAGALGMLVDAALPTDHAERVARGQEQAGLRLVRKADGSGFRISRGELDLETGELLLTVLDAARATDPDTPADTAAWAAGRARGLGEGGLGEDGLGVGPAPRTRVRQDHDALRLALRALLDSGVLGTRGKVAPHLQVTVGLLALHGAAGALPARSASGTRFPVALLSRWLPDSALTRTVLGIGHKPLETSHTARTLKAHERRALELQWGHRCADRDCAAPPGTRLVPHHGEAWHRVRTTSLTDTVPLCDRSHQHLHVGGHVLRLRDGRQLGPDGWA